MDLGNMFLNNNISYKIISPYQKIENDKERIKSKFNFNISRTSTNSSVYKNSTLPTQKNSRIYHNIKKKILQQNNKQLNITHYRPKSILNVKINSNYKSNLNNNKSKHNAYSHSKNKRKNGDNKSNEYNKSYYYYKNKNQIINDTIINAAAYGGYMPNITYNNYFNFLNDNSMTVLEGQKIFFPENALKTHNNLEEINNYNSKSNNKGKKVKNKNNFIRIENENDLFSMVENTISESLNKSSFSGSSKTSELHGDMVNNKNNNNSANERNIQVVNNDNYVIKNFNFSGVKVNDNNNKQQIKNNNNKNEENENAEQILSPYADNRGDISERRRTEVTAMGLLDDDEYNQENRKKMLTNFSKFYFIEDIIELNNKFISLSFNKFKTISNKAKYKIFSYVYDNYKNFLNSSIYMRTIIKEMLEEKFSSCIKDFENKYKNILSIENYQFNIHEFLKPKLKRKKYNTFCLYIKTKVLPNNKFLNKFGDISFEISYKYKIFSLKNDYNQKSNRTNFSSNSFLSKDHIQEEYMQIYKFDLRKNKNYPMWICSERDEIFNNATRNLGSGLNSLLSRFLVSDELYQKHLIYSSPIINVNENDYIVFRIDLIENNNIIENISFNEPIVQSVEKNYYHKISFKQEQKFDKMRDCENELAINVWHDEVTIKNYNKNNINYEEFFGKLRKVFEEYFEILNIKFDISKFAFIRMTMKAKKIGTLKSNIFSNKDIKIVESNTPLTKECTTINFVNTFSIYNNLIIRQGTVVDFYLME